MKKLKFSKKVVAVAVFSIGCGVVAIASVKSFAESQYSIKNNLGQSTVKLNIIKESGEKEERQTPNLQGSDHSGCFDIYMNDCATCNRIYKGSPEGELCKIEKFKKYQACLGH